MGGNPVLNLLKQCSHATVEPEAAGNVQQQAIVQYGDSGCPVAGLCSKLCQVYLLCCNVPGRRLKHWYQGVRHGQRHARLYASLPGRTTRCHHLLGLAMLCIHGKYPFGVVVSQRFQWQVRQMHCQPQVVWSNG